MSKEAALRAMREAKYAARSASPTTGTPARRPAAPAKAKADKPAAAAASAEADEKSEALCGHRSMNGRTCTREAGHAAKSHRYS